MGRVPFPEENYAGWNGEPKPLAAFAGRPLLINLWSETCAPCIAEVREWTKYEREIRASGLRILALCVDDDPKPGPAKNSTLDSGVATPGLISAFETMSRALLESRRPLPVPCSILLDAKGHVAAIYKGVVSHETLIEDAGSLDSPPEKQRVTAVPFPGRWSTPPLSPLPRQVIGTLMKTGRMEAARAYAIRCLDPKMKLALAPATLASITMFLGSLHLDDNELDDAVTVFASLLEIAPEDAALHREIGKRLVVKQRVRDAIQHLSHSVALDPAHADTRLNLAILQMREGMAKDATVHFRALAGDAPSSATLRFYLATALQAQGMAKEAVAELRIAHGLQPGSMATNNLAWILATASDDAIRNGKEAVALAKQVCEANEYKTPRLLNTPGCRLCRIRAI